MVLGMGIVFIFLIILMFYLKLVPYLTKLSGNKVNNTDSIQKQIHGTNQNKSTNKPNNPNPGRNSDDQFPEIIVAAIATAIYHHTGKIPKGLMVSKTERLEEIHNIWGITGRQELMQNRDLVDQVGFQF